MPAFAYSLEELISAERRWERYRGRLADGRKVEILLINVDDRTQAEETLQPLQALERRCAVMGLLADPGIRKLVMDDFATEPPVVALEPVGDTLDQMLVSGSTDANALEILLQSMIRALAACHAIGLTAHCLNERNIYRRTTGTWMLDVLSAELPEFEAAAEPAVDIHDFGQLAERLFARADALPDASIEFWRRVTCDCCDPDEARRPTARELLARLRQRLIEATAERLGHSLPGESATQLPSVSDTLPGHVTPRSVQAVQPRPEDLQTLETEAASQHSISQASAELSAVTIQVSLPNLSEPSTNENEPTINLEVRSDRLAGGSSRTTGPNPLAVKMQPGDRLGRYTIESRLGAGAMGAVYKATDAATNQVVAIKVLNRVVSEDSLSAKRFAKEARLLAKVNNPYVANLFEVNSEEDRPFMAVEFVDGGTLGEALSSKKPLDERFALAVIADAVRGLSIAHSRGITHRDFKPDNVLLTQAALHWYRSLQEKSEDGGIPPRGTILAKVSDFGLARMGQQSESLAVTRDGALLGTPLYMSPEQCRGEPAGPPADVYAVGITLYQMLVGKTPFTGDSHVSVMSKHCNELPPPLKSLRPGLSEALVQTIEKCLAKNADARYQNAGDLLIDIENLLLGRPTSLGLHPPILSLDDPQVMKFQYSWDLNSSPANLWPYVANTDRVNHAIGLPSVSYTTRQDPVRGTERFGETVVAGQRIRWQEHPYEWIEGRRLSVLREFAQGPFRWFVNVVQLQGTAGGGTRLEQQLIVAPRNWIGKQLARLQLGKKSQENFGRIYNQIDGYLSRGEAKRPDRDAFVVKTEISAAGRNRLVERIDQLRTEGVEPNIADGLHQYILHASDLEVARIRPLELAARFGWNGTQVVDACLIGTRLGIFNLLWDILCPSCRIPSSVQETLSAIKEHGHCEACNIGFELDLAKSVELIFRVHPEIRSVETRTYCIGGPAWSRHVVAQLRLAADERFACDLQLTTGSYVVRGPRLPFAIDFRVAHNSPQSRVEFSLGRPPTSRAGLSLQPDSQVIHLLNDSGVDQQIRIERTASQHDALTAAHASTLALFRELFPDEVLAGGQIVNIAHVTILQIKLHRAEELYAEMGDPKAFAHIRARLEQILSIVKASHGAIVKTIGEGALASFATPISAVVAALEIYRKLSKADGGPELPPTIVVHSGPAMAATLDDRLDYFGYTLQQLAHWMSVAAAGKVVITHSIVQQTDVQMLLEGANVPVRLISDSAPDALAYELVT